MVRYKLNIHVNIYVNKIVGNKMSRAYYFYLCLYIPTRGTHIYWLLCILYIYVHIMHSNE